MSARVRCGRALLVEVRSDPSQHVYGSTTGRVYERRWSFVDEELWRPVMEGTWDEVCRVIMDQMIPEAEGMRR